MFQHRYHHRTSRDTLVQRLIILKQVNRRTQALSSSLSSLSINQMSNRLHVFVETLTRLSKSINQGRFTELPDVFPLCEPQTNLRLWESVQGAIPCGCLTLWVLFFLYIPVNIRTISVRCHLHHFPRPILCLFQTMVVDTPDIFLGQMSFELFYLFSSAHAGRVTADDCYCPACLAGWPRRPGTEGKSCLL